MIRKVFLSFRLLLVLGLATVVFNSYGQNNKSKKEITDPLTYDKGVIINGVKWATRNVATPGTFVAKPEDSGMFYQWNRKTAWPATGDVTDWNNTIPEGDTWVKINDPSPAGWRIPTIAELKTLLDTSKVSSEWISQNGVGGREFIDKANGNSIFLPAVAGRHYVYGTLYGLGLGGCYWSSTQHDNDNDRAYGLNFNNSHIVWDYFVLSYGLSVRCVAE
jgi:uncharacterized protein (TIGR02145 family)